MARRVCRHVVSDWEGTGISKLGDAEFDKGVSRKLENSSVLAWFPIQFI